MRSRSQIRSSSTTTARPSCSAKVRRARSTSQPPCSSSSRIGCLLFAARSAMASSSSDPTTLAVTTYGRSPITNDIQGHVSFFPLGTAITGVRAAGVTATPIATTSSTSYAIAQPRSVQDLARKAGDASGPFNVMETLEQSAGSIRTRIVIVGTAGYAENRTMPPTNSDTNLELALTSFQLLAAPDSPVSQPLR